MTQRSPGNVLLIRIGELDGVHFRHAVNMEDADVVDTTACPIDFTQFRQQL